MWRHAATKKLYLILWLLLPIGLLVPSSQLFTGFGFYLVFKLFIIDFIFLRFPRLKAKYDTSAQIWMTLPTDADLDARHNIEQVLIL